MEFLKRTFAINIILLSVTLSLNAQNTPPPPQTTDVTITLNEKFFDGFLELLFRDFKPMEFSVAKVKGQEVRFENASFRRVKDNEKCSEVIKLEREISGTRTAVRFRDGKMMAPLAFSGSYDIPLFGCVDFTGWAETQILLDFDREKQALMARVKVNTINLNGVTGLASGALGKLMQNTVDKKVNPTTLLSVDKLSFVFPLESMGGNLKMRATDMRPEVSPGELKIRIFYELTKQ